MRYWTEFARGCLIVFGIPLAMLTLLLVGLAAGEYISRLLVDPGVGEFEGEERALARAALQQAEFVFRGPWEGPSASALRVTDVRKCADPNAAPLLPSSEAISAEIRVYGPFGIPSGRTLLRCDGSVMLNGRVIVWP